MARRSSTWSGMQRRTFLSSSIRKRSSTGRRTRRPRENTGSPRPLLPIRPGPWFSFKRASRRSTAGRISCSCCTTRRLTIRAKGTRAPRLDRCWLPATAAWQARWPAMPGLPSCRAAIARRTATGWLTCGRTRRSAYSTTRLRLPAISFRSARSRSDPTHRLRWLWPLVAHATKRTNPRKIRLAPTFRRRAPRMPRVGTIIWPSCSWSRRFPRALPRTISRRNTMSRSWR